jgi:hypothetical protein
VAAGESKEAGGSFVKVGHLAQYFEGAAWKVLSEVETDPTVSHQHEFNGVRELERILGKPEEEARRFPTVFLYLAESADETVREEGYAVLV